MTTYFCPPMRDAGPNVQTPSAGMDHWAMVDDNPHDSDTTFLTINQVGREVFDVDFSAIPVGSIILSVTVRVTQKETAALGNEYLAGLFIGGVDALRALHDLSGGTAYQTNDEVYVDNPVTLTDWTLATLGTCQLVHDQRSITGTLPSSRLTQVVLLVDAIPPPARPNAGGDEYCPRATPDDMSPSATGATVGPSASSVAVVKGAVAVSVGPSASGAVVGGAASAAVVGRSVSVALQGKPTADAASRIPTASGVALSRSAIAVVILPKGTAS